MFERSRRKIVAAIMSILGLLFLGSLAVIYGSSYFEVASSNNAMLEHHAELYSLSEQTESIRMDDMLSKPPRSFKSGPKEKTVFEDMPSFRISTFYTVAVAADGAILATDTDGNDAYSAEDLASYAQDILRSGKERGMKDSLIYLVSKKDGYVLVSFMDNIIMHQSMLTLFRYTLVFGGVAIVALFFLAAYFAKRIVQPLEESHQIQKQFIADASHELKTPVSIISANAELLHRVIGDNQWLGNIQYENDQMGTLVTQLLELARTENVKPQYEQVDLSHLTAGEILPFESVAFEKGLLLDTDIAEHLLVDGCSMQLRQLVSILVDNAIRHSDGGCVVKLSLKAERRNVVLSVVNAGSEIPEEERRRLFERFYRTDEARNSATHHYGLGLAIAKSIITAHDGRIEILCYEGLVEFRVTIPRM